MLQQPGDQVRRPCVLSQAKCARLALGQRWSGFRTLVGRVCLVVPFLLAGCGSSTESTRIAPPIPPQPMLAKRPVAPPSARLAPHVSPWRLETRLPESRRNGGEGYRKVGKPYRVAGRLYVPRHQPDYDEAGLGSWYGAGWTGKLTANGERFRPSQLTAAHPTLPLPSYVHVTNLANGKSVRLRVNDRGPFVPGRIIDVSPAAAEALGFRHRGLTRVRVRYAGPAPLLGG